MESPRIIEEQTLIDQAKQRAGTFELNIASKLSSMRDRIQEILDNGLDEQQDRLGIIRKDLDQVEADLQTYNGLRKELIERTGTIARLMHNTTPSRRKV